MRTLMKRYTSPRVRRILEEALTREQLLDLHSAVNLKELWESSRTLLLRVLKLSDIGLAISLDHGLPSMTFTTAPMTPEHYKATYEPSRIPLAEARNPGCCSIRMSDYDTAYLFGTETPNGVAVLGRAEWQPLLATADPAGPPLPLFYGGALPIWRGRRFAHLFSFLRHYPAGDFTDEEMRLLEALAPDIETALLRVLRTQRQHGEISALNRSLREERRPLLVLDWKLHTTFHNPEAAEASRLWNGEDKHAPRERTRAAAAALPPPLQVACRALRDEVAREGMHNLGIIQRPLTRRQRLGGDGTPGAEIIYFKPPHLPVDEGRFIVRFAARQGTDNDGGDSPALGLDALTLSEQAVADLVAAGHANGEVAAVLGLSIHTVRAHLRAIFRKLGVKGRAELAARAHAGRN